MSANVTDMLKKSGSNTVTTLSAPGKALGATSINVGSTTNYPTDTGIIIAIRQVDSSGALVAGTYTEWSATVSSATSLAIVATPVLGSDQIYAAGSTTQVYIPVSSYAQNKLIDNILEHANQDGSLITQAVRDALNLDSGSSDGWTPFGYSLTSITALGNRSYTAVVSGTDTTGVTSVGMRLKLPRTVTAPTGSLTLNGTTQYANKTSPSGMTFTDDFVVSAWVKLSSYLGTDEVIASRASGASGWILAINSSAQVYLAGYNGVLANFSRVTAYQSLPLNKWVHVTAQLDMSTFTASTTTSYVMLDGKDVPAVVTRGGTNPTALVQAGNLEVGSVNAGGFFPGQIAQVAIYSAKVTQATILASMNQTLTGSETSLVSAYKLDQASGLNDLSANANNLTAQGSPTYSTTQTPFTNVVTGTSVTAGTTNYGIIMAQTFSTNTTYTIQIPEGETLPTTGGIGTVSYSTQKTPYGFPGAKDKWQIATINKTQATQGSPTQNSWYNPGSIQLTVPVGQWMYGYQATPYAISGVTGASTVTTLSTTASTETDPDFSAQLYSNAGTAIMGSVKKEKGLSVSAATLYYLLLSTTLASNTSIIFYGVATGGTTIVYADNALL